MVAVSNDVYQTLKLRKQRSGVPVTKQIEMLVAGIAPAQCGGGSNDERR